MTDDLLSALEADILAQPELLSATLDLSGWDPGESYDRIIFTGCGDSYHAAIAAAHVANGQAIEPHDILCNPAHLESGRVLLVAISNSGKVRTTFRAAALARERGARVVAVTSRTDSPLASASDMVARLPKRASDRPLPGMSSYLTSMLAAMMPFLRECDLEAAPDLVTTSLDTSMPSLVPGPCCLVGALQNRATALYSAAKLAEVMGDVALACHTEEFCHVELFLMDKTRPIVLFPSTSDDKITNVHTALRQRGFNSTMIGCGPECEVCLPTTPDELLPLVNCVPVQRAVLELAKERGISSWNFFKDEERLSISDDLIY
ncbi:MAG: SIS domain-containing protein [Candidatus Undinarchaeales archaeon]|jgi:fructoselysine-6-P-deglycase FrlB-like protein|nr:SIS domain-containing protein [Candidatus Undinarchaeales archaeon]MDP7491458.1 SIS domain-containing protein [Candidatus Undinarchaeales archaeon]